MNLDDLERIPDPIVRFAQSVKFIRLLQVTAEEAQKIRNEALLYLRETEEYTLAMIGEFIGVTHQRIIQMEHQAKRKRDPDYDYLRSLHWTFLDGTTDRDEDTASQDRDM